MCKPTCRCRFLLFLDTTSKHSSLISSSFPSPSTLLLILMHVRPWQEGKETLCNISRAVIGFVLSLCNKVNGKMQLLIWLCDLYIYPSSLSLCEQKYTDGYTTEDLVFQWKESDPVQVVKNLHLPRFTLQKHHTSSCTSKTNTGNVINFHSLYTQ